MKTRVESRIAYLYMLAALQALDRALIPMDYSEYRHAEELSEAIIAARAAIAKATQSC